MRKWARSFLGWNYPVEERNTYNCSREISNTAAVIVAKICCVEAENIVVGADASLRNLAVVAEPSWANCTQMPMWSSDHFAR